MFWKNSFPGKKTSLKYQPIPPKKKNLAPTRLFEDILCAGSILRVKVTGRSMAPFLHGGEIVTIKNVPCGSLFRGDLIFFKNIQDILILHRIVHKKKGSDGTIIFLTKGDALRAFDEPVPDREVLGKVVKIEKTNSRGEVKHIDIELKSLRVINYIIAITGLAKSVIFYTFDRLRNHRPPLNAPLYNKPFRIDRPSGKNQCQFLK